MQRSPAGAYLAINIFLWGAFLMSVAFRSFYLRSPNSYRYAIVQGSGWCEEVQ
jgi:hypothetical protein